MNQISYFNQERPFIIAEMSGNHNKSIDRAKEIILAAAKTGVQAVKFQTYKADTITINHRGGLFDINDPNSLWNGKNLYELYQEACTPYEWHAEMYAYARSLGLIPFSTPFDETAVDFLEGLDNEIYKIASFENNHHPLLKRIAQTGKPVIMSTGISTLNDIQESVDVLRNNGCKDICLLKCTSTYPATAENSNLITIPVLKKIFPDCTIGLSDHTMGIGVAVASVALGARVIEKHFTLARADGGVDSAFSMEPHEMKMIVDETERAFLALGSVQIGIQKAEEKSLAFKRSIYVVQDIKEGDLFTADNIRVIRPGDGAHPRYFESLIGTRASHSWQRGQALIIY